MEKKYYTLEEVNKKLEESIIKNAERAVKEIKSKNDVYV